MKKLILTASVMAPMSLGGTAYGQSVNYGDLQELFGEPVTTSATGKPQRQSEAPASMVIITGDELRRSGARTLPDILQNYSGIDMNRYATGQRDMTVRGGNMPLNPRLLVLVNGRQAYLDHYGYTDWNLLGVEMSEIQQIEVVKGPNSALFGFNAAAGVVNIITIDPLATGNKFSASAQGGTHDTYSLSAMGSIKLGEKTALRVSAGMQEEDDWGDITTDIFKPKRENFSGEFTAQIADNVRATASYTYAAAKQATQAYNYDMHNSDSTLQGINGTIAADTKAGLIKAQVFYNTLDQDVPSISEVFGIKNNILSVKLEDLLKVGSNHSFRLGVEYRRNEYEIKDNAAGQTYYDVYAASGMWEWQASEKLVLTNAVRIDRLNLGHGEINEPYFPRTVEDYDKSYTELSYNSSLSYTIDDQTRIRVGAARGIQAPSLNALGVSVVLPNVIIVAGNPDLAPSVSKSYEIAFDRNISAINGSFNLTGSMTDVTDFLAASHNAVFGGFANTGELVLTDEKLGDFKTYSIEAVLDGRAMNDKLGWSVNYTWTDVKEDLLSDAVELALALDSGTPAHKVNVKFDYVDGPWNAYVVGRYRSATEQRIAGGTVYADLGGNVTFDARVGYTMDNGVALWLAGENLTSNNAAGLSTFRADSRFLVGVGVNF